MPCNMLHKLELYCPQEDIVKKAQRLIRFSFDNIIPSFQSLALDMGDGMTSGYRPSGTRKLRITPSLRQSMPFLGKTLCKSSCPHACHPHNCQQPWRIRHSHCTCR
mmetsp:Transcript_27974/g.61390  ORF Transcript_27974/g.61390 Transcript_27974/m.61390 type:complete len:106 (+) Transcript_27974:171-488(+)